VGASEGVRRVVGHTALVVALFSIAVLLLIVGVVLRMGGLDLAADVAQLVSAVPTTVPAPNPMGGPA
jgi:carbon starvation protein CstA